VGWKKFDPDGGGMIAVNDPRQLPPQQPANPPSEAAKTSTEKVKALLDVIGGQTVEPPTLKEEAKDEVPW
jgi:hypothetical protein